MFIGEAEDRLDDVVAGTVDLKCLSSHDRALIAGNPHSPSWVIEDLSFDESYDVANWLLGNFGLSEQGVLNVLQRHPSLASEAGHHPRGPIDLIAGTPASTLSTSTLQAYMDRVGATESDWARVHDALSQCHPPEGPAIGELMPPPR